MAKMSDGTLTSICEAKLNNALGWVGGLLSKERTLSMKYYRGDLFGNEQDGRSKVVSRDVAECIDGTMPSLLKVFAAVDTIVRCNPKKKTAEESAKQATDYLNHVFQSQPNAFDLLQTWIKSGLMMKLGIVKSWWDDSEEVTTEEYEGLTQFQYLTLLSDDEVEPISFEPQEPERQPIDPGEVEAAPTEMPTQPPPQANPGALPQTPANMPGGVMPPQMPGQPTPTAGTASPPAPPGAPPVAQQVQPAAQLPPAPEPLFNCKIKRTKKDGKLCIECLPPEEFLTDRRAVDMDKITFAAHRSIRTVSDIIEMGVSKKIAEGLPGGTELDFNTEVLTRFKSEDESPQREDTDALDPALRHVWVAECYLKVDYNGDGVAEWRKVTLAGSGGWKILFNDECDGHPFSAWTPFKQPHKLYGESMADKTMDVQLIKSTVWRATMDELYFNTAPQLAVVEGQANMEDALTRRPGGVIRIKQQGAVEALTTTSNNANAMGMMSYMDSVRESRVGMRRWSPGLDGSELNPLATTATGVNSVDEASDDTLELIARNFGEQGVKPLFKRMLELICKHQQKALTVRLRGKWVDIDPSTWDTDMDMEVMVGLGTGSKDRQTGQMMSMITQVTAPLVQAQGGLSGPLVTAENVKAQVDQLTESMGFKSTSNFFSDPAMQPPKGPPPPDPKMVEAQGKLALQKQKQDADLQHTQQKAQLQAELDQQAAQRDAARERDQAQADIATDRMHAQNQAALEQMRLESERQREEIRLQHDMMMQRAQAAHDAHLSAFKAAVDAHVSTLTAKSKANGKGAAT